MSPLSSRLLVAGLGIPLLLFSAVVGGVWLKLLIVALQFLALREWRVLGERTAGMVSSISLAVAAVAVDLLIFSKAASWSVVTALLLTSVIFLLQLVDRHRTPLAGLGSASLFALYICFPFSLWCVIASTEYSRLTPGGGLVMLFAGTWLCDSLAYFGGRALGRHKLYPAASPNKTVEGLLFGIVGVAVAFILLNLLAVSPNATLIDGVALIVVVGLIGQGGDLVESMMKRECAVKDSSRILLGHGGILDRFDSLLVSTPSWLAYLLLSVR